MVPAGSNPTTRQRGETVGMYVPMVNKAKVEGARMEMMQNAAGQMARRAPKKDILR
jgi:hypothetical protein